MRSRPCHALFAIALLAAPAAGRTIDEIRRDSATTWARLVALDVHGGRDVDAIEASDDLARAWELMGEFVAATLRVHPDATARELRDALRSLDAEDRVAVCKPKDEDVEDIPIFCELAHFGIEPDVLALSSAPHAVFALAVSYSYFGRLLVVSGDGVVASRKVHRRGEIRALPDGAGGAKRFYVRCDWGDWPTS